MYASFVVSELKKWLRDPLMKFMVFYPIILGFVGRFAVPVIAETSGFNVDASADLIIVILTLMTPLIFGAVTGFSILDDRDDNVLPSVKVTPLSIHQFISFKIGMVFILTFIASNFVMAFSCIGGLKLSNILAISFLASLAAPMTGLFINALAHNKIEGFAVMKGTGVTLVFPIVALFFIDSKELIFSFAPGFWPAKAISSLIKGEGILLMTYNQYYFIGLIYVILLNYLVYRLFLRRIKL